MKKHRFPHQCRNIHSFASHTSLAAVLVAISIPIFTAQLEKSRETVDASNLRAAYAEGQVEVLTADGVGSTSITKYYDPSSGKLVDSSVVCGKGTATDGGYKPDLPSVCFYTTTDDVTTKGIEVVYDETGVTSVSFK